MERDIEAFKKAPKDAVFLWYLGVVNHWVTLVIHKSEGKIKFYFLDSSNLSFLDKVD
jgi:hypothetical protein